MKKPIILILKSIIYFFFLPIILAGCLGSSPSDEDIKKAIENSLHKNVPVFIVGNLLGGKLVSVDSIKIEKIEKKEWTPNDIGKMIGMKPYDYFEVTSVIKGVAKLGSINSPVTASEPHRGFHARYIWKVRKNDSGDLYAEESEIAMGQPKQPVTPHWWIIKAESNNINVKAESNKINNTVSGYFSDSTSLDPASKVAQLIKRKEIPAMSDLYDAIEYICKIESYKTISDPYLRDTLTGKAGKEFSFDLVMDAFIDFLVTEIEKNGWFHDGCKLGNFCDKYVFKSWLLTIKNAFRTNIQGQFKDQILLGYESWSETRNVFNNLPCYYSLTPNQKQEMEKMYTYRKYALFISLSEGCE